MDQMILMSILQDELEAERDRQKDAYHRLEMMKDNYHDQVYDRLNEHLSPGSMKVMAGYINTSQNVYKRLIKRLSKIYKKAPVRIFKKGDIIMNRVQAADIIALYDEAKIDLKLKAANHFFNACNTVFLGPVWRDNKLCLDVLTPDQVTVVTDPNDPTIMNALMIARSRVSAKGEPQRYWQVWTQDQHYLLVETGVYNSPRYGRVQNVKEEAVPGNEQMINPYGFIPFVVVRNGNLESAFWDGTTGDDLYLANLVCAVRNTLLDFAAVWQSFKQVAVETDADVPPGLTLAPDTVLHVAGGAKWSHLDLTAAFDQIRGDLQAAVQSVAQNYGISSESFNAPSQKSGVALKIENQELQDNWSDQIAVFTDAEYRLWDMIKRISEIEGRGIQQDIKLSLRYPSIGLMDEKSELENDAAKMAMGIVSPASIYMKYNENAIDEIEAELELKKNLELYRALQPKKDNLVMDIGMDAELEI